MKTSDHSRFDIGALRALAGEKVELMAALKHGEVDRLSRLLAGDPWLVFSVVQDPKGGGRSPLHLFADWPGHKRPGPAGRRRARPAPDAARPSPVGRDRDRVG